MIKHRWSTSFPSTPPELFNILFGNVRQFLFICYVVLDDHIFWHITCFCFVFALFWSRYSILFQKMYTTPPSVAGKELMWTVTLRQVKVKEAVTPHPIDFHSYACDCGRTFTFHCVLKDCFTFWIISCYVFNLCF